MRRVVRSPAVIVLSLLFAASPTRAQELGLVAVRAVSDNVELPGPTGLGAFAEFEFAPWRVRVAYLSYEDATRKSGVVCQVYSPRIGCRTEAVATSARLSGLRITAVRFLHLGDRVEVSGAAGLSFNQLTATSTGESGWRADLHMPNAGQIGYLASVSAALTPIRGVPVKLVGRVSAHRIRFRGCVSPEDRTSGYAPFCGWEGFTEIELGASVVVPRP